MPAKLTQKKHSKWRHPVAVVSIVACNQQLLMNGTVAPQVVIYDFIKSWVIFRLRLVCESEDSQAGVSSFKISQEKIM